MTVYVFVGPTLSVTEARQWLDAVYLPPAAQGDIVSLLKEHPTAIGVIDGYFEHVPAVWHKEILLALSQGVQVVGGASMGALRAAELQPYGMVGVGEIFEWYRDGLIEADDEVAVHHAPAEYDYKPLSEAMVNIRKSLQMACQASVISLATHDALIAIGRRTNYPDRSYNCILDEGAKVGLPEVELSHLKDFLATHTVDLKKQDAIRVLETLSKSDRTEKASFELQHTVYLEDLIDKDQVLETVNGVAVTVEMLVNHARLECDNYLTIHDKAIADTLILETARQLGVSVTDRERRQGGARFKKSLGLATDDDVATWTRRNHVSDDEFQTLIEEWLLIEKTKMHYLKPSNRALIRQFRLNGDYEALLAGAARKEEAARQAPRQQRDLLDESRLYAYYAERGRLDDHQDIQAHATRLGFTDEKSLLFELERHFLYHADNGYSDSSDEPKHDGGV